MHLIVGKNKAIVTPLEVILKTLRSELTNGKLKDIASPKGMNIPVTCPIHKDGREARPSCYIFMDNNDKDTQFGTCHCFTCGYAASLPKFIADCFEEDDASFGEEWLLERCNVAFVSEVSYLPPISLDKKKQEVYTLDEQVLQNYNYYHDYMWYRKLTKEVVDLFEVGYDPTRQMITFPVRDDKGRLLFVTGRSVVTKFFHIPDGIEKPVYLLYHIKQQRITDVAICESQINALYLWSCGIPAVALFGTGSPYQYELLKKSGIRSFRLYFDGDDGGRKGAVRFKKNMPKDVLITDYMVPQGKDVNDLTLEEIESLKSS